MNYRRRKSQVGYTEPNRSRNNKRKTKSVSTDGLWSFVLRFRLSRHLSAVTGRGETLERDRGNGRGWGRW